MGSVMGRPMRRYKGFYIPRAEKYNSSRPELELRQRFCFKCRAGDCSEIPDRCFRCLFFPSSQGDQKEAFDEWFKAKGKVKHD